MKTDQLKPYVIVKDPILPEPVRVITTVPMGDSVKLVGKGLNTGQLYEPILDVGQFEKLESFPEKEPFDGDPTRFRLGIEALRLGLAYEYAIFFSNLWLELILCLISSKPFYDYFLSLPRIRFNTCRRSWCW